MKADFPNGCHAELSIDSLRFILFNHVAEARAFPFPEYCVNEGKNTLNGLSVHHSTWSWQLNIYWSVHFHQLENVLNVSKNLFSVEVLSVICWDQGFKHSQ